MQHLITYHTIGIDIFKFAPDEGILTRATRFGQANRLVERQ
jgi:hypothetical protein